MINHWSISIQQKSSCTHVYAGVCVHTYIHAFAGGSVVENLPANTREMDSVPGLGRSPGDGNDNLL